MYLRCESTGLPFVWLRGCALPFACGARVHVKNQLIGTQCNQMQALL
jgi:hypothetical protein